MLANSIQGMVATKIITPVSAANTAAATSGWIAVGVWEGDVQFTLHTGAVTGSMASILQTESTDYTVIGIEPDGTGLVTLRLNV
jgi:hypothetical protein